MTQAETPAPDPEKAPADWVATILRQTVQERRLTKEYLAGAEFQKAKGILDGFSNRVSISNYWEVLSALGRAASVSKPAEAEVLPLIRHLLSLGLGEHRPLSDGEDRYYLAKALELAADAAVSKLALDEVAREDFGEKARAVWVAIALSAAQNKSDVLVEINQRLARVADTEKMSSDNLARRIRRVAAALIDPLIMSDLQSGAAYGASLRRFFVGIIGRQRPEDRSLREEFCSDALSYAQRIVRLNFAAGSDPALYLMVGDLREWWSPASPPSVYELKARQLAGAGVEALYFFARQGVKNEPLREAIALCCGEAALRNIAQSTVASDPSLDERLAHWLVRGTEISERRTTEAIEQINSQRLDEHIARLLVAATGHDANPRSLSATVDRIDDLLPDEARTFKAYVGKLEQILQWTDAICRARSLEMYGGRGDEVPFDPSVHVGDSKLVVGSLVRIVNPGVVKAPAGRPPQQILKAEVSS